MIVSHSKKFIFVKTRKTSGTSMEVSLSQVCGPDDIITPISFEDELVRLDMGGTLPQNYAGLGEQRYRNMIKARKMKFLRARRRGKFFNHMPAVAIREHVGKKTYDDYFTFSIERHPYEKVVSHIYYHARGKKNWSFDKELERVLEKKHYVNYPTYSDGEKPIVDFIVNFDNMQEDLTILGDRLEFDIVAHYPQTKHRFRTNRRPASELLSQKVKDQIYKNCRIEFDAMGYER